MNNFYNEWGNSIEVEMKTIKSQFCDFYRY